MRLLTGDIDDVIQSVIEADPDQIALVTPGARTIEYTIDMLDPNDSLSVAILANESTLKTVTADFTVASKAADLEANGLLRLRSVATPTEHALLLTDSEVVSLLDLYDGIVGLASTDPALVDRVRKSFDQRWDNSADFSHRTPPMSEIRSTLEEEIGEAVRADFDALLSALESTRGPVDGVDEVVISLLAAARNNILLYDISKWGEDVGVASKATYSRTKTILESNGLIETEKVPIEVGRPRLRLILGEEKLRDADPDELANVALSVLD